MQSDLLIDRAPTGIGGRHGVDTHMTLNETGRKTIRDQVLWTLPGHPAATAPMRTNASGYRADPFASQNLSAVAVQCPYLARKRRRSLAARAPRLLDCAPIPHTGRQPK
ncbi:hypothetical protein LGM35_26295 [Burkholderia cenocepacia]|uniref:hypothetical protein n=1 Tax=Burkholderia cenocepacia TaxID=95486 RepID=UPI001CF406ED|nr:hypothetical protein [Burkholderia cenocepacia]MCA7926029.1 hypothetical protein [Burkholderia cenocepacia]